MGLKGLIDTCGTSCLLSLEMEAIIFSLIYLSYDSFLKSIKCNNIYAF